MSYSLYDFTESIACAQRDGHGTGITLGNITKCLAAWSRGDSGCDWSGGFLVKLDSGKYAYIEGWCDYSGWGWQDGGNIEVFDKKPKLKSLGMYGIDVDWELNPPDLNKWIKDGCKDPYD